MGGVFLSGINLVDGMVFAEFGFFIELWIGDCVLDVCCQMVYLQCFEDGLGIGCWFIYVDLSWFQFFFVKV